MKIKFILFPVVLIFLISCEKDQDTENEFDPYIQLESYAYTITKTELKAAIIAHDLDFLEPYLEYDVSVHHFTYNTMFKDSVIFASGAICLPVSSEDLPVLSYQHGTIFYSVDTPSEFTKLSTWGMEMFAASGYITFISDYIGYGTTKEMIHPYHLYTPSVDAVIDMILAGIEFLKSNKIPYNDQGIFLAGFSEGGYATFAVQKEIETNPECNLEVIASAPGAGAYDLEYMFDLTTENDYYTGPGYMGLALLAYNDYYWNQPLEDFFNPDYIHELQTVFDGSYTESAVHNSFPPYLSQFLDPDFLTDFKTDPENPIRLKLVENSLNNWVLNSPTRFIHGTDDQTVPYAVAQKTYDDLIDLGVNTENLMLQSFNGGHNGFIYSSKVLDWFNELNK